jgi:hypothetical protein
MTGQEQAPLIVPAEPRRHPVLRAALGCLLIAGMAYGWFAMARQKSLREVEAIAAVRQAGGRVYLDFQWEGGMLRPDAEPPEAAWLRGLLGPEIFDHAVAVDLRDATPAADVTRWLPLMPELRALAAKNVALDDESLGLIGRLLGLTHLDLSGTPISDQGIKRLERMSNLSVLTLAQTGISDQSVAALGRFRKLRRLDLTNTQISDQGIQQLADMLPKCRISH